MGTNTTGKIQMYSTVPSGANAGSPSVEDLAALRAEKASKDRLASERYIKEQEAIAAMAAPPPKCPHGSNPALCLRCFSQSKMVENDA